MTGSDSSGPKVKTYKDAGVDIEAGAEVVRRIAGLAKSTHHKQVISDIGGFSGLYRFDSDQYRKPVLVSSTDGVGSKIKVALMADKHDTIGIDLVAMVVNDLLAQGAKPLFFLDYLAMAKVEPTLAEAILIGITAGCRDADCSLIGGETAELPDFYGPGEYDLAGFGVGVVDEDRIIDGSRIKAGDHIIGLASSGLHSNGYTLARRVIFDQLKLKPSDPLLSSTVAEEMLKPTRIYVRTVQNILADFDLLGVAHITGGGLIDNVPRILPANCQAAIDRSAFSVPPIFDLIRNSADIDDVEMHRTFNMGVGLVLIVRPTDSLAILARLKELGETAWLIGEIRPEPSGPSRTVLV